jgi:hypothetical protein
MVVNTDSVMTNIWLNLVGDFRRQLGPSYCATVAEALQRGGIKEFRSVVWPGRTQLPPWFFKREYQLENLFKRYRFHDDVYTDAELAELTIKKFLDTQVRVARFQPRFASTFLVLREARTLAAQILGSFDMEEVFSSCSFGRRASYGVPYRESYLDSKLSQPISGSLEHIAWFQDYLASDSHLNDCLRTLHGGEIAYALCDTLTCSLVPKKYNSLRLILPNTTIGSFYTMGLGKVIQSRLLKVGLDIRYLQAVHQRIVKRASVDRRLVTADLSAASDSIVKSLLRRILPSVWYKAVLFGHIPYVRIGEDRIRMETILTMGLGHTFPLETLIFYVLLRAIANLLGRERARISVYGDDLIYPKYLHRYVERVFHDLNLLLNRDKTFVADPFRESCGSDYFHGVDVRPFQPEGQSTELEGAPLLAYLFKMYNGLTRRWSPEEIPDTLAYLRFEITRSGGKPFVVPPSFPDSSGIKVEDPFVRLTFMSERPIWDTRCCTWRFKYLRESSDFRKVISQFPFYWEKLRTLNHDDDLSCWDRECDSPILRWRRVVYKRRGKKWHRLQAGVSSKVRSNFIEQESLTTSWA